MSVEQEAETFVMFLVNLIPELLSLYRSSKKETVDPDEQLRLAMAIVKKTTDEEARRAINGQ